MSIYLDYNATAPLRPEVIDRVHEVLAQPMNASSVHSFGRHAKKILEDSRKTIAEAISAFPNEIIFCSSGTEANNWALRSQAGRRVLVSAVEHSSVLKPSPHAGEGWVGGTIPVTSDGVVDINALDKMLRDPPPQPLSFTRAEPSRGEGTIVSVMLANNETGIIQPIREVAEICKKHGALLHCDAVQGLSKIPLDFSLLGVDMMTISAHKMGGPVGAAALVVKQSIALLPMLLGGGQELSRRAGTENISAIAGFAKAVELIDFGQMEHLRGWFHNMEQTLAKAGAILLPITNYQLPTTKLPNTSCLARPATSSEVQLMHFDLKGIAISAGSACSSGRIEPSHVLGAMGIVKETASCAIRVSGGWNTKQEEIEAFTSAWLGFFNKAAS